MYGGPLSDRGAPSLAVDTRSGRVYLATEGTTRDVENALIFRSDNDGLSFAPPVVATGHQDPDGGVYFPKVVVDNYPGAGQGTGYLGRQTLFGDAARDCGWPSRRTAVTRGHPRAARW